MKVHVAGSGFRTMVVQMDELPTVGDEIAVRHVPGRTRGKLTVSVQRVTKLLGYVLVKAVEV